VVVHYVLATYIRRRRVLGSIVKFAALTSALLAYIVYVLFHPKYSEDYLKESFVNARTLVWGFVVVTGLVLTLVLRSRGLIPAGVLAILLGYVNFRFLAASMSVSALDRPMFFSSGRDTTIWFLSCVAVVLLGLTALLVQRLILGPIAAGGLVLLHFAVNTVSGIRAGNREVLLVQAIVQSYVAARSRSDSELEGAVLTMTLDLAAARMTKRMQGSSLSNIGHHLDYLKREVATGEIGDITKLAELALAIISPLPEWNDGGMNDFHRQMAEHGRRAKLVASCLDAAAIPARLRGKKTQSPATENEPS